MSIMVVRCNQSQGRWRSGIFFPLGETPVDSTVLGEEKFNAILSDPWLSVLEPRAESPVTSGSTASGVLTLEVIAGIPGVSKNSVKAIQDWLEENGIDPGLESEPNEE